MSEVSNIEVKYNKNKEKYGFDFYYENERHQSFRWTSERKAKSALLKYIKKLEEGKIDSNIRFQDLLEKYYEFISSSINKNTLTTKKTVINKHILPVFDIKRIRSITIVDLSNFLSSLLEKKFKSRNNEMKLYSNQMLDKIQTELWSIFEYAHNHGYLSTNPTLKLNRVRHNTVQPKKKFYRIPAEDAYAVVDKAESLQAKLMLLLSYEHGMRPSEISGLDIGHIDPQQKMIHIKQAWKSKEKELTPTKNGKERYNATSDRVIEAYNNLLQEYEQMGGYAHNMPLFGLNHRVAKTTMDRWKNNAIKNADVKHFTWYDARHTHITDLLELGFKPYQVAERMGHTEVQTLDYAIVDISEQFDMVNALEMTRNQGIEKTPKKHQNISKQEIMTEINKLLELLND